ncbi:MAG: hypothetical protein FWC38_06720 [Proteobacteria bacterium]|nr:hypothetical protein [Pseudomonadota bacterium]MCL2307896.1 hypothetical protein [Pseudomonadota bacterium]
MRSVKYFPSLPSRGLFFSGMMGKMPRLKPVEEGLPGMKKWKKAQIYP